MVDIIAAFECNMQTGRYETVAFSGLSCLYSAGQEADVMFRV